MKRSLIPAALLVLLATAACGAQQAGGAPEIPAGDASSAPQPGASAPPSLTAPPKPTLDPPTEPVEPPKPVITTGPSGVVVPPGLEVLPPEQVDAKALPADQYPERRVWVTQDDLSLQFFAMAPDACTVMEATVESADAARVTLAIAPMAQPRGSRRSRSRTLWETVRLSSPWVKRDVIVVTSQAIRVRLERPISPDRRPCWPWPAGAVSRLVTALIT